MKQLKRKNVTARFILLKGFTCIVIKASLCTRDIPTYYETCKYSLLTLNNYLLKFINLSFILSPTKVYKELHKKVFAIYNNFFANNNIKEQKYLFFCISLTTILLNAYGLPDCLFNILIFAWIYSYSRPQILHSVFVN